MKRISLAVCFVALLSSLFYYLYVCRTYREELQGLSHGLADKIADFDTRMLQYEQSVSGQLMRLTALYESVLDQIKRSEEFMVRTLPAGKDLSAPYPAASIDKSAVEKPTELEILSLDERLLIARETMRRVDEDPILYELVEEYSRGAGVASWNLNRFVNDHRINPFGLELTQEQRHELELLYYRAANRIKEVITKKRLAISEGVAEKIEQAIEAQRQGIDPKDILLSEDRELVASSSTNNFTVHLTREEYPEIHVLASEKKPAIATWLEQVRDFFNPLDR